MAASSQLEAIFIATPPSTPLSLTRTTTPRDLPTMYHFDFAVNTEQQEEQVVPPPAPLTRGTPIPEERSKGELTPCPNCSRTFNLNALRKHVTICEKMSKKRNIFDSSRQRREGTELATYVLPKNFGMPNAEKAAGVHTPPATSRGSEPEQLAQAPLQSPLSTRRKSQGNMELARSTIRASLRKASSNVEPPTAALACNVTRERRRSSDRSVPLSKRIRDVACDRCPHCERTFNPKAFDRHVEWCKEKAVQATIKSTNSNETNKAKERLEARKQYRPPNLKTKRSMNRDKYSGANEELLDGEMVASKQSMMSLSSLNSSVHSENGLSTSDKYDPFLSAKRQLEELCSPVALQQELQSALNTPTTTTATMSTSLNTGQIPNTTSSTKQTPISNFRRTSSLRVARRTPLLPSRPLFATNYRPTIQRGLSDEGPISSNFLKPEEYDEMPVRAACGNDFHSPRVVRRDTSASNRKQQPPAKLQNAAEEAQPRSVAKTDSLAVFLRYEHELEQLNAKAAEAAANQLSSKELKDKSNNLSKQNSAKSIKLEALTTIPSPSQQHQLPPTAAAATAATTASAKENNENLAHNFGTPLRLEPIISKVQTATLTKPTSPQQQQQQQQQQLPLLAAVASTQQQQQQQPPPAAVKLNSIFTSSRPERKLSSGSEPIDPKLINPCDNLHVQSSASDDSSTDCSKLPTAPMLSQSSSQSTITQLCIEKRNSAEGRNLLKRKMRLGRNQFLYDASPEHEECSSCCSADDEANRSSMEYDEQCWKQPQLIANTITMPQLPLMPSMPTFDDFDFEEFLSSFENDDDEQFPLFKDCREFLLNRTTSRQRSLLKANSMPNNQQQQPQQQTHATTHNTTTGTQRATTAGQRLLPLTPTQLLYSTTKATPNAAHRSNTNVSESKLRREPSNASSGTSSNQQHKQEIFISIETEPNAQGNSPISPDSLRQMVGNAQTPIEMVQIDNGNEPEHSKFSKLSDSDEAAVEFDDERPTMLAPLSSPTAATPYQQQTLDDLPNVEFNNAKNRIQQMQTEFRQMSEEACASMRKAMQLRSGKEAPLQQQQQQHQQQQSSSKAQSPMTPSGDSGDELSSLDGYPISQSSRRGASSKRSTDSAYGSSNSPYSLSRQRSTELSNTARSQGGSAPVARTRPHTANAAMGNSNNHNNNNKLPSPMMDAATQAHSGYGTLKARQRLFGAGGSAGIGDESSSSGSENSLAAASQPTNYNYQQQQQPMASYGSSSNNNMGRSVAVTPTTSQHSLLSNASMSSSMKMSKFCHECGAKFIIEQAKFCMECGVRRMVL